MDLPDLQALVARNASGIATLQREIAGLVSKERRAEAALESLRARVLAFVAGFDRDAYKATDSRLSIQALAEEVRIFERLGYDLATAGAKFLLGIDALLAGRNQAALEQLESAIGAAPPGDPLFRHGHYLAGMISYNRRDFHRAGDHFATCHRASGSDSVDWQSGIYVAELLFFRRAPADQIEKAFVDLEEGLLAERDTPARRNLLATLYLKRGNSRVGTLDLEPRERNTNVNDAIAISDYKRARASLPTHIAPDSLLPVVIDFSLAQALLRARSIDMELAMTPAELFADAFRRLRRIVLTKREEIIAAQSYLMLGVCGVYSDLVSRDAAEIYLEYARTQTLSVPSDVCFYSCATKELLPREDFVAQIDFYSDRLQQRR